MKLNIHEKSSSTNFDNDTLVVALDEDSDPDHEIEYDPTEVQNHDRNMLEQEDAEQRLLGDIRKPKSTPSFLYGSHDTMPKPGRRLRRRWDTHRRTSNNGQEDEVMFEMEGGFKDDTSSVSSQDYIETPRFKHSKENYSRRRRRRRFIILGVFLICLSLAAILYGTLRVSTRPSTSGPVLNNGTHDFKPTSILISLDGFRADFLNLGLTPTLNTFIKSGVSPKYMLPSFPSVTFPNHFTLVTGLYPESHGIVGNQFWDPQLQEEFYYTDVKHSMQPKWWTGEPLWMTAETQGVRTAVHMWPGSEAHIGGIEPMYLDKFNETESLERKVDRMLGWIDLPDTDTRPQLIAAYVPDVDADGHLYGPNSTEIRNTISNVDDMLTLLVEGLYARNLTEIVNLIIVSDHGMATTSTSRMIQLDDIIDLSLVDHTDGWPLRGLRLKNADRDLTSMVRQLTEAAAKFDDHFEVYTLETMPKRYHFTNNDRIAPLWVIPKAGWAVVEKSEFDLADALITGNEYHPKGLHGYDNEHPLMRSIFVARGPAFPHKANSEVPAFQNIEVYNIVCDSLGITPHQNNGTLRLPLKTIGLHKPEPSPSILSDSPMETNLSSPNEGPSAPKSTPASDAEPSPKSPASWWDYIHGQIQKAKAWADDLVKSLKGDKSTHKDG